MKYFIHAVPERLWYLNKFLIPRMLEQGIKIEELEMYIDNGHDGNLVSCLNSLSMMSNDDGGTWHLQDDIMISHDFADVTHNVMKDTIMCGMCMDIDEEQEKPGGKVDTKNMWYSFQCIYIPNKIALHFVHWFNTVAIEDKKYTLWISKNKYDDSFFREFMLSCYPNYNIMNIMPNIVNHIDYMLDGSLINKDLEDVKDINRQAKYFEDRDSQDKLEYEVRNFKLINKMQNQIDKLGSKPKMNIPKIKDMHCVKKEPMNYN